MAKCAIKIILFFTIGIGIFLVVQEVLRSKSNVVTNVQGLELLEDNTVDVLGLGTSSMAQGMSAMKAYEDISSCWYNLGSSGQPIECSYYMASKAFQTQSPKIVILDVSSITMTDQSYSLEQQNSFWRLLLDSSKLDETKLEMAMAYGEKEFSDGVLSVFFPIIKYHTRWTSLTSSDFNLFPERKESYSAGEFVTTLVKEVPFAASDINWNKEQMEERNEEEIIFYEKEPNDEEADAKLEDKEEESQPLYSFSIDEENIEWVKKIDQLCAENGAKLILVKIPTLSLPMQNSRTWTQTASDAVKEIANDCQMPFYDFLYDYDIQIDLSTDFADGGSHLNMGGAEKVTAKLIEILKDDPALTAHPNAQYDTYLSIYQDVRNIASLQMETDFYEYINMLSANLENWTIFISASNEYTMSMTENDYEFVERALGLELLSEGKYADSYVAVIEQGELQYEAVSNRRIEHDMRVASRTVSIVSSGWYSSSSATVTITGKNYAQNGRGLNFVVYDNETRLVIDSVTFDTHDVNKSATRSTVSVENFVSNYAKVTAKNYELAGY